MKNEDVNTPVENPHLKKGFKKFSSNKTEANLQILTSALAKATFLVLIKTDGIKSSPISPAGKVKIEVGSTFNFLKTYNENGQTFQPLFTDWKEIDLWVESRDGIAGWMMSAKEVFEFVIKHTNDTGIVVNPCSDKWGMNKEQMILFLEDIKAM